MRKFEAMNGHLGFVLGFPRSGTTMLTTQLGRFGSVATPPETVFFHDLVKVRLFNRSTIQSKKLLDEMLKSERLADLDVDLTAVLGSGKVTRRQAFLELLHYYRIHRGADYLIEKSPDHSYFIEEMITHYPASKFVAIVRDGRDALLSLKATPWAKWSDWHWAVDWAFRSKLIRAAQARYPSRLRSVKFEEFVSSPEDRGAELFEWLFDQAPQRGDLSKTNSEAIPEWEALWKGKAAEAPDAARASAWCHTAETKCVRLFEKIAGDELGCWGYESPPSTLWGRLLVTLYSRAFPLIIFSRALRTEFSAEKRAPGDRAISDIRQS